MLIKLTESVLAYLRARETEAALAHLSDAALDDIGLTRAGLSQLQPRRVPARRGAVGLPEMLFAGLPFQATAQAA